MSGVLDVIWHGLRDSLLMAWEVWWALVLGFAISAVVQAWVPRSRIERSLGRRRGAVPRATLLGAASSSCSYAAVAIAKSLFEKGATAASALAFQFASTNLVWELGLVLWVLIGWQFTLAEYLGGVVMIGLMTVMLRVFVSPLSEAAAREHAQAADAAHHHHSVSLSSWRQRLFSAAAWSDVGENFRHDWQMVYREVVVGFLLAGLVAQVPNSVFRGLFLVHAPAPLPAVESVVVGPVIAVLSFVCSVGNVPLAAVLWSGGISFAGVLAFLFADLIVLPIVAIYRKYYGAGFALRITALMYVTMALAALAVAGILSVLGLIPTGPRPTRSAIFGGVAVDYKLFLNVLAGAVFVALLALAQRRGQADAGCRPPADRGQAAAGTAGAIASD